MTKSNLRRLYAQRDKVVRQARKLARTGRYTDLTAILPELEPLEGYTAARERFNDRTLLSQLNRLCAIACGAESVFQGRA
jgi:hypothetical protein